MSEVKRYSADFASTHESVDGGYVKAHDYDQLKAENERLERNRDMWKGQVELQAEELTSLRKDAEQWRALVGRAKDPVIGYTGCVIFGSADHGGWSCQNLPGGKS